MTNLALNPDFESGTGSLPTSWTTHTQATSGTVNWTWATDQKHGGVRSVKIYATGVATNKMSRWLCSISGASPGNYNSSAWIKTSDMTEGSSARFSLTYWNGIPGSSTYLGSTEGDAVSGTQDWIQKIKVGGLVPSGTTYVRLECKLYGSGTVWFDDVTLERSSTYDEYTTLSSISNLTTTNNLITSSEPGQHPNIGYGVRAYGCMGFGFIPKIELHTIHDVTLSIGATSTLGDSSTVPYESTLTLSPSTGTSLTVSAIKHSKSITSPYGGRQYGAIGYGFLPSFNPRILDNSIILEATSTLTTQPILETDVISASKTSPYGASRPYGAFGYGFTPTFNPMTYNLSLTLGAVSGLNNPVDLQGHKELAPNNDFELGSGNDPTSWWSYPYSLTGVTWSWATDQKHGGSRSIKISATGIAPSILTRWLTDNTIIPVTGGKRYRIGVWIKTSNVNRAYFRITYFNDTPGDTTFIGEADTDAITGTHGWSYYTKLSGVTPANTVYIRLECMLYGSGTVWFDDASAIEIESYNSSLNFEAVSNLTVSNTANIYSKYILNITSSLTCNDLLDLPIEELGHIFGKCLGRILGSAPVTYPVFVDYKYTPTGSVRCGGTSPVTYE